MPDAITIAELDAAAIAAIAEPELAKLEDARLDVPTLSDTITQTFGGRPHLVIDITDPPSQPKAIACGIEATGATADESVRALAEGIADAVRDLAAELGVEVGEAALTVPAVP